MSTTVLTRRRLWAVPPQTQSEPDMRTDMERIRERLDGLLLVLDRPLKLPEAALRARALTAVYRVVDATWPVLGAGDDTKMEIVRMVLQGASGYPLADMRRTVGHLIEIVDAWLSEAGSGVAS